MTDPFDVSSMTDQEIVDQANALAREFYQSHGYEVPEGFKFHDSEHPHEVGMWNLAVIAYEFLTGTDITDSLANIDE